MRGNTVTIEMPLKRGKVSKTIPLYQYDYGQKLLFTGIELPAYYEVHFSNEMHGEATTKIGTSEGVDIPDVYLSTGEPVYLWLYLHSEVTDGETEFQGSIPVIKRASISDQTPTEQEATVIAEAIVALNEAVEALDGAVESAEAAQEGAEAAEDGAEEQALKAEGYAIGKQAGEDVDSSSPYYHNNAKYYNDQAGSSATAASGSATAASGSASSAESWATGGSSGTPSATNNAKYYSEQAASSASTANSAKSDAVSAKNTAATWATGGTSGTPGSTNNAKYYSEQAAASASSSANNKTAAETAQGKAEAAQSAAETAQGKAEDAQGAAETAQGKAEDAQTAAETAQDKAEDAQDAAETAQTAAEAAQTAAETAQGKAEDAQEAAEEAAATMANKADKVSGATSGNFAGLDSNGNLTDSGKKASDFATATEIGTVPSGKTVQGEIDEIEDALETKAEVDGYYDELTAGNAEQLISNVYEEDSVPYNFRTSGGSIDIGDREFDEIVGGTVCWNQIQKNTTNRSINGVTFTYNNGELSIATAEGGATENTWWLQSNDNKWEWTKNHIYYISLGNNNYSYTPGTNPHWYIPASQSLNIAKNNTILKFTADTETTYFQYVVYTGNEINMTFIPQIFDLTQMFGSTIADYILALETATEGAGVAWFRNLFPKDYYAYDAGSLQSVQAKSHVMRGFNAWDEEWELGRFNTETGVAVDATTQIRSKNNISVLPSTTYYIKSSVSLYALEYDIVGNFIKCTTIGNNTLTTASNTHILKISLPSTYGTTYNHDICINLHWDGERDGEYEAYSEHAYPLDADLVLRGIPKLDSNNKLYYDGDTYESDGTVTRKYGIVNLGDLTWIYENSVYFRTSSGVDAIKRNAVSVKPNILCPKFTTKTGYQVYSTGEGIGQDSNYIRAMYEGAGTDPTAFKSAMNGVYAIYELATPTTTSSDPYQNPQIVDDFGTEEYIDAGVTASTPTRDVAIPVGHNTKYTANLKAKLEMSPDSPSSNGDYVVRHNNGTNTYVLLEKELPSLPSENGTYLLKCTVSGTTKTLSWEEQT